MAVIVTAVIVMGVAVIVVVRRHIGRYLIPLFIMGCRSIRVRGGMWLLLLRAGERLDVHGRRRRNC
jgi:hypothetical protein